MLPKLMPNSLPVLSLFVFAFGGSLVAQNTHAPANLINYSRQELIGCLYAPEKCHAHDIYEVEVEVDKRLSQMSTADLVSCYSDWHICGDSQPWLISDILRHRGETNEVIHRYGSSEDPVIREGIEILAYDSSSDVATDYMRAAFTHRIDDGNNLYWPAMYLAKHCNVDALRYLDPGPNPKDVSGKFIVSSAQFASTAELFGKCHYRAAIPYLVAIGMHAASLNVVDAAAESLRKFYPNSPHFDSLNTQQQYFCARAHRDGFHVNCSDD
jgi:hypothetical protein